MAICTMPVEELLQPFSEAEFEDVYRRNFASVYNYERARVGPDDGEDVAAEVFQAAAMAWRDGEHESITTTWLLAVAHNKVIDRWRRASVRRTKWHLVRTTAEASARVDEPAIFAEPNREAVLDALDQLQPNQRAILVLHYVDGFSSKQIGAQLEMTSVAVDSALARARRSFRRHFEAPEEETP